MKVAGAPPTVTAVAPARSCPVTVITVPPRRGPEVGAIDAMVGWGTWGTMTGLGRDRAPGPLAFTARTLNR